ncbi:MAG: hypothetical protein SF162_00435 [bacterium]|nr:hypothetical protein [bacterium]
MKRWLLIFAGALAVLFNRLFMGEVFFWGLPALQFVPWRAFALEQLRSGIIPVWNPYTGAGAPLFANYQSQLLYPFSWISFFAPTVDVLAWVMSVTAVVHLLIAAWGMHRLTGLLHFSDFGRAMSALAFGLGSYLVGRLGTFPMISAAAWLPWVMAGALLILQTGQFRGVGWLAFFSSLLLSAGHAQLAWYSLLLTGLFTLWWAVRFIVLPPRIRAEPRKPGAGNVPLLARLETAGVRVIGVAAALLLGAGVAAVQLAATAELLGESQRSDGAEYSFAVNFSYAPLRTANLLSPHVFGTPGDGSYLTQGAFFEDAVYIGFIPLVSAIAAVIGWLRGRRPLTDGRGWRVVPFAGLIVLIGFLFALGYHTAVFPFLYFNVPTFDLFQAPVRWHLWTVFGLALLAGAGVEAWGRDFLTRRTSRWGMFAGLGAVVASLTGLVLFASAGEGVLVLVRAVLATGILAVIASLLSLRQPQPDTGAHWRWSGVVLVVVVVDLVWANWGLNPTAAASVYTPPEQASLGRLYLSTSIEEQLRFVEIFRFDDYRLARAPVEAGELRDLANFNLLTRRETLNHYDPLRDVDVQLYTQLIDRLGASDGDPRPLLRGAGVTAYRLNAGGRESVQMPQQPAPTVQVIGYESACWEPNREAITERLTDRTWQPETQVILLGEGDCPMPSLQPAGTARIIENTATRVTIEVQADRLAWVVLADTHYPGWRAYMDDAPVPMYQANLAFRAVQVDDGTHIVTFGYGPAWLLPGIFISVICVLLMVLLIRVREPEITP